MRDLHFLQNIPALQENNVFNLKFYRLTIDDAMFFMEKLKNYSMDHYIKIVVVDNVTELSPEVISILKTIFPRAIITATISDYMSFKETHKVPI